MAELHTICILVICLILLSIQLKNYFKCVILAFKLKGPPALPIFGNVFMLVNNEALQNVATYGQQLYGRIIRGWITIVPCFIITEPEHLQVILTSSKYGDKTAIYQLLNNFFGRGLIISKNDKQKANRRLIQPYFQNKNLDKFLAAYSKHSKKLVDNLEDKTDFNITKPINDLVLNIICDIVLGIKEKNDQEKLFANDKPDAINKILNSWPLLDKTYNFFMVMLTETQHIKCIRNHTRQAIEDRKKAGTKPFIENTTLLDIFCEIAENNPEFTEDDIIDETSTFMLAAQDSVSSTTVFSLYFLAKYIDIQNKVRDELTSIYSDNQRLPTANDLYNMKYLEQCIKETMRLCPSVPLIARQLTKDITLGSYNLPCDAHVLISPMITQRLPHIFPDPLKYDPDRFSSENLQKIDSFAYIPFSAGPRNCIGNKAAMMEVKTIISILLRNFEISLADPAKEVVISYKVTLRLRGGLRLRLKRINHEK